MRLILPTNVDQLSNARGYVGAGAVFAGNDDPANYAMASNMTVMVEHSIFLEVCTHRHCQPPSPERATFDPSPCVTPGALLALAHSVRHGSTMWKPFTRTP